MAQWMKLRGLRRDSYGTVYLGCMIGLQKLTRKLIAVKSSMPYSVSSVLKERKIMEWFSDCEEIVSVFFGQYTFEKGLLTYNLVMEFSPYVSLGDLIRKSRLSESEVRIYSRMLLKGLSYIHQKGVVHGDLKPDNILLFPSSKSGMKYQLKIADFGLYKNKEEAINTIVDFGKIKFRGTPFYMSSESVIGLIGTPLDLRSLGCIVLEMITGLCVWQNLQIKEIMVKLAFHQEAPKIPDGLCVNCQDFLNKCFARDPSQRWTARMLFNHPFLCSTFIMDRMLLIPAMKQNKEIVVMVF